jgi:hypothetical protein
MNPLEKEFVPYPEAFELKQLGFDEEGLGTYSESGQVLPLKAYTSESKAILFSQAFRWFREKHHLIGGVEYIGGATPSTTWWDIYVVGHFNTNASKMTMKYQPYEEAELACLRKLIEIVKNK